MINARCSPNRIGSSCLVKIYEYSLRFTYLESNFRLFNLNIILCDVVALGSVGNASFYTNNQQCFYDMFLSLIL